MPDSDSVEDFDLFGTPTQGVMKTHGLSACEGSPCCVHNPSEHHMRDWPLTFNMRKAALGERECEHFFKHPDPDSYAYFLGKLPKALLVALRVHNCCGCCRVPKEVPEE